MKISSIQSTTFQAKANIKAIDNKKHPYLYNEVLEIARIYKVPATFRSHEIELQTVSNEIYKKLNELKIRFYGGKKH